MKWLWLCLFFLLGYLTLPAQGPPCYSGYVYDLPGCPGINTFYAYPNTPLATNTYSWPSNVTGATLISGQGTAYATYDFGNATMPSRNINVSITSSQYNCTYIVSLHVVTPWFQTDHEIQGSIPSGCASGQVEKYWATRWLDTPNGPGMHNEYQFWSVTGGTVVGNSSTLLTNASPYYYARVDTVSVVWNNAGSRRIILNWSGTDQNAGLPSPVNCSAKDTLLPANANISGPNSLCLPASASYTIPPDTGCTYNWSVIGGSIGSGQGTDSVTVAWTGAGAVICQRSYTACGASQADTFYVSASAVPSPNLGPNGNFCQNNGFTLNAGPGMTYLWNTGATSQTIQPTASGTYSVTVSNLPGCQASDTIVLNMLPQPAVTPMPDQSICQGSNATFSPAGAWSSYAWNNGASSSSITVTFPGNYAVTLTDANGCSNADTANLSWLSVPSFNLGADTVLCGASSFALNGPAGASSYAWSTGSSNQNINVVLSGTYSLTVTNAQGCQSSDSITVTLATQPSISPMPDQSICTGATATFSPAGTWSSYAWSNGSTNSSINVSSPGAYAVTLTDANGCSNADTANLSLLPLPSFSLGADTILCADTSFTLNGPASASSYAWSTGASTASISIGAGGTYILSVTDGNGCQAEDTCIVQGLNDCVFPGDANYDGVADNLDVLAIGAYYGRSGSIRPAASQSWFGQASTDWGSPLPLAADPKHSDCDGNGLVDVLDTLAVWSNYGQTHTKSNGSTGGGIPLRMRALQDTVLAGQLAWFVLELGDLNQSADSVYGLAFELAFDGPGLAGNLGSYDFGNCWFAPNPDRITMSKSLQSGGSHAFAVSRTDQQEVQGFGEVARFAVPVSSNGQAFSSAWTLLSHVTLVNSLLMPRSLDIHQDSIIVADTTVSIGQPINADIRLWPNPANRWIQVEWTTQNIVQAQVIDLQGRMIRQHSGNGTSKMRLDMEGLSDGMYWLELEAENGQKHYMRFVMRKL